MKKPVRLYRPVGRKEFELIRDSNWQGFPPRLPHQPIFYPVANYDYAAQIARDWNTKDAENGSVGIVLSFDLDADYLSHYPKKIVGDSSHAEYWIPAEELEEFNKYILSIQIENIFFGE